MTPELWNCVVQGIGSLGLGFVSGGLFVHFLLRTYGSGYLAEKGRNLATKQDIEQITRSVEGVKSELLAHHTLRFAALERRLEAHQEAFMHIVSLAAVFYSEKEDMQKAMRECRIWWSRNCLYLEEEAKTAFDSAFNATQQQSWRHTKQGYALRDEQELYQKVLDGMDKITRAVNLPPLNRDMVTDLLRDAQIPERDAP